jgi:class I lanthipeptide synthase
MSTGFANRRTGVLESRSHGWVPVLDGHVADLARGVADEIARQLARRAPSPELGFKGDAAAALLLAQCGLDEATARLEGALVAAVARPLTISLFGGLAGMAWVLEQLVGAEAGAVVEHFDAALWRHLDVPRWEERYDLMSGLAGVGALVADRRAVRARQIAERVLFHLERSAIVTEVGAMWRTPRRPWFPLGMIDLGVAHGTPGIIGMLARFVEAGVEVERSRRLLVAAVGWLLDAVPMGRPRYGTSWPIDYEATKRIGWCYGDAGVAGVLLRAGRALGVAEVEATAVAMLRDLATPLSRRGVPDASFCHGAAGLSHVYNVAFQLTGDDEMRRHAVRWLHEILRMRSPDTGIGGYRSLKLDGGAIRWEEDPTLLSGAVGIALVLLAAIEDREPAWQRLFLL